MSAHDPQRPLRAVQPSTSTLDAEQLRAVFAGMAVGMLVVDSHGLVIDCNAASEALLGLPRVEIIGRSAADARWQAVDLDGQALAPNRHPALQVLRTGLPVQNFEMGVALIGGARRWLMVNSMPLRMDNALPGAVLTFVDVGRRRTLEHNLTEQSRRLRAVLEGTRTATWQWHLQTDAVQLDARWLDILGLDAADTTVAAMRDWLDLVHPDDQAQRQACLQQHFDGQTETFEAEYRMQHRDGSWRWVRDRGRVCAHDGEGRPLHMLGTHDDITPLKEAELDRSYQDELLRALFELSPLGLQLIDVKQRKAVAVNDALVRITGYTRDELLQSDGRSRFAESSRAKRDAFFDAALKQGRFGPTEVEYHHRSGRLLNLVFHGVRVTDVRHQDYLWLSVADMTERHALERDLRIAASQDVLTGLANRSSLLTALQQQVDLQISGRGQGLAVMFMDLDRFKFINDALGHTFGDDLLRAVALRLREAGASGSGWTVARLGGDEFVVLAPGASDAETAQRQAHALVRRLSEPYTVHKQQVHAAASLGITIWRAGISEAEVMLRDADTAMYEAKRAGRGRCVLFDDTMRARLTRAVVIENELRHAVERCQLEAVYQPIVDLETGAMSSVEALLRWNHPELGAVSPNEFIPVAEESGHITALGEWILRTACRQWAAWQRQDPARAPATISVNLSREQVAVGRRVLHVVREALDEAAMPAAALQLEITEREVMKQPEQARDLLLELSAMGVKLAMDDFGTGTSSLGCLREFPFDTIKIDKSFVTNLCRDPQVLAVAHATVTVIENLGMVSVAEGIEDPAEVAALQAMGCRYGQGYLFARPVKGDALLAALS